MLNAPEQRLINNLCMALVRELQLRLPDRKSSLTRVELKDPTENFTIIVVAMWD